MVDGSHHPQRTCHDERTERAERLECGNQTKTRRQIVLGRKTRGAYEVIECEEPELILQLGERESSSTSRGILDCFESGVP